jgi:hypothetical protein
MTVEQLFRTAGLSPCGPVRWMQPVLESEKGVYVIARVDNPQQGCSPCDLRLCKPLPKGVQIDQEYEARRWLREEPVLYIGKADQPLKTRLGQFYAQKCGKPTPHAGGQAVLLLDSDLWVFWSPCSAPRTTELAMLAAFEHQASMPTYANFDGRRRPRRIKVVPPRS